MNIENKAFFACKNLITVTIPLNSNLTAIGEYAFSCCISLTIVIPNSVKTIGYGAFMDCNYKIEN